MLKVVMRTYPLSEEGRNNRLQAELEEERSKRLALENTIKQQGGSMAASETAYVAYGGFRDRLCGVHELFHGSSHKREREAVQSDGQHRPRRKDHSGEERC